VRSARICSPTTPVLTRASVYLGFFEYAVIVGDMHMELFSAAAQRIPPQARIENAKTFASRIISVHDELKQV